MVRFLIFFTNMVMLNMVFFLSAKYGNKAYGDVFEIITIFCLQNMVIKKTMVGGGVPVKFLLNAFGSL